MITRYVKGKFSKYQETRVAHGTMTGHFDVNPIGEIYV